ncbi:MAG TPA: transposase [Candidatus Saccharimonadales bacterium]|nr:transposase [Candidatus Saccharimonadales bacterium]
MVTLSSIDVGVDVSKKHLDIHLHQIGKSARIANSATGITELEKLLAQYNIGQVACEATGGYERLMYKTLRQANYKVWRVEPRRIKAFIASEGIKAKTDKIDAKMIALFASKKCSSYEAIELSDNNEKLKSFVTLRTSINTSITAVKAQLQQSFDPDCHTFLTKNLNFLEKQLNNLTKHINALIETDQDSQNKATIITSIPGVGDTTAATMLAMLPELGKINNKQAAALVGVAPYIKQSGNLKGHARINGGRAPIRRVLYMAALSAITCNSVIKHFYQRLIDTGKAFKVAIVAVMRKLVIYMNTLTRKGELWNSAI